MADTQASFRIPIIVSDNGTIRLATNDINKLGVSVKGARSATSEANKASTDFFDTQKKGIIGTANSTKSFSKLAESLGNGGSSGLVGAYATLAANLFAVSAAFNALRGASQVEQIFRGLEASGNRVGRTLTQAAAGLKEVTNNAISTEQALRSTAQISSAGFGADTINALGKAARDTSFALGRNMTDSLDRLTRGVVKLEPELLDELGIMTKLTESNTMYASKLGKTETQLTNFEKRQGFLNAVLAEATLKFGGLADAAGDSTVYDNLSATLTDLSNTIFGIANTVFKPIAALLSGSFLTIVGVGVLFASTIKNQLAPGLLNSAALATKTAAAYKADAEAKLADAQAARTLALENQKTLVSSKANFDNIGTSGPKAYLALRDAMKEGTATDKQREAGLLSLRRSYEQNLVVLEKYKGYQENADGSENTKRTGKIAQNAGILQEIKDQQELTRIRGEAATFDVESNKQVQEAERQQAVAAQLSLSKEASAKALNSAANFKLRDTVLSIRDAHVEYRKGLELSGEASNHMFAGLKAGAATAALSVRAVGAAFLNAIPIIGQVLFAIGLISSAFEALKSSYDKELEKRFTALEAVVASASDKVEEYNRIQTTTAPVAQRVVAQTVLQSNAINELVDSYLAVMNVQEKAILANDKYSNDVATFGSVLGNSLRSSQSWQTGLKENSAAIDVFSDSLGNIIPILGGVDKKTLASAQTLGKLLEFAPEATKRLIDLNGGVDKLSRMPLEAKQKVVADIAKTIQTQYGPAGQLVQDLADSFKNLNQNIADYSVSQLPTTPFDTVVKGFQSVQASVRALGDAERQGASLDYSKVFTGIGTNLSAFLKPATAELVEQYRLNDGIVQTLKGRQKAGEELNAVERQSLATAQRKLNVSGAQLNTVNEEVNAAAKLFSDAQASIISDKARQAFLEARLGAVKSIYALTGAGLRAQYAQEDNIRALQINQLQTQKSLLDAQIANIQNKINEVKVTSDLTKAEADRLVLAQQSRKIMLETALTAAQVSKEMSGEVFRKARGGMNASEKDKYIADTLDSYHLIDGQIKDARDVSVAKGKIEDYTRQMAPLVRASQAISDQISTILESAPTAAEKISQINALNVKNQSETLTTLQAQRVAAEDLGVLYESIDSIINDTSDTMANQLKLITQQAAKAKEEATVRNNANVLNLRSQLEIVKATASRPGVDKEAGQAAIDQAQQRLDLATRQLGIELDTADATALQAIAQKVVFDTQKEGLEWQQTSLGYVQKQLDATRSLAEEMDKTYELQVKLAAARKGVEVSAEGQQAIDIRAATTAYNLALSEVSVKKSLIDLEYALLDAQKEKLQEELQTRKLALQEIPGNEERVRQLDAVLSKLENVDLSKAADTAKAALDQSVKNARLGLEQTMAPKTIFKSFFNDLISVSDGINARRKAEQDAQVALAQKRIEDTANKAYIAKKDVAIVENPLITVNKSLVSIITKAVQVLESNLKVTSSTSGAVNPTADAVTKKVVEFFQSKGYTLNQAAGIAGNLKAESGNDPYKVNGIGMAGLAQFSKRNQAEFMKQFGHSVMQSTVEEQLKFINDQLNSTEGAAKKLLMSADSIAEAAVAFRKGYERPGEFEAHDDKRIKYANQAVVAGAVAATPMAPKAANDNAEQNVVVTGPKRATLDSTDPNGSAPSVIDMAKDTKIPTPNYVKPPKDYKVAEDSLNLLGKYSDTVTAKLSALGPDGEAVSIVISGMTSFAGSVLGALKDINAAGATTQDKFTAIAGVISAGLDVASSAIAAQAQLKTTAIDKEIAAEQKRDGKSAESVAKIAAFEKKKDEIGRKAFNANKKIQMAQAVIATAAGIAQALTYGPIAGPILAGIIGAMGLAQIAIIAGTSYQSTASTAANVTQPSQLTIGKAGDSVDLAKQNSNPGGELGYLRGKSGTGSNASNYSVIGSAYGGDLPRGYGNAAYVVGEKGPETIVPMSAMTVRPANDNGGGMPVNATINIHALDASGVEEVLQKQKGNLISMFREAANANGKGFMEDVNVSSYSRPNTANRL